MIEAVSDLLTTYDERSLLQLSVPIYENLDWKSLASNPIFLCEKGD